MNYDPKIQTWAAVFLLLCLPPHTCFWMYSWESLKSELWLRRGVIMECPHSVLGMSRCCHQGSVITVRIKENQKEGETGYSTNNIGVSDLSLSKQNTSIACILQKVTAVKGSNVSTLYICLCLYKKNGFMWSDKCQKWFLPPSNSPWSTWFSVNGSSQH